jgi:DNA modification methylase
MIAAERLGRRARLAELDPKYVDVSVQRWQAFTGGETRLEETGETFAEVAARRHPAAPSNAERAEQGVRQ